MNPFKIISDSLLIDNFFLHPFRHVPGADRWTAQWNFLGTLDLRPRLGSFDSVWDVGIMPGLQMPLHRPVTDRFDQLMDQRGEEVLRHARSLNKRVHLLWSGGIDSTAVLVSLLKQAPHPEELTIVSTSSSIHENSEFYCRYVMNRYPMLHFDLLRVDDKWFEHNLLLHGDPGDALFGNPMDQPELATRPWRHSIRDISSQLESQYSLEHSGAAQQFVRSVSDNLLCTDLAGELKTVAEWWWWMHWNLEYQGLVLRYLVYLQNTGSAPHDGLSPEVIEDHVRWTFYNTARFNAWALQRRGHTLFSHKSAPREYIWHWDRQDHYYDHKTKIGTITPAGLSRHYNSRCPVVYDRQLRGHRADDPGSLMYRAVRKLLTDWTLRQT